MEARPARHGRNQLTSKVYQTDPHDVEPSAREHAVLDAEILVADLKSEIEAKIVDLRRALEALHRARREAGRA